MGERHHSIRRQFIHVELHGTEEEGFALQRRLSELCRDRLLPALERALDRVPVGRACLQVRRLDLDAGTVALDRVDRELAETVARCLESSLRNELSEAEGAGAGENARLVPEAQILEDALVHFLKTGRLPWSLRLPAGESLERLLLDSWLPHLTGAGNPDEAESVRSALAHPAARHRLASQFSPAFLRALRGRLNITLRESGGGNSEEPGSGTATSAAAGAVPSPLREPPSSGIRSGDQKSTEEGALRQEEDRDRKADSPDDDGSIYLNNAGLVLLHPFLLQFFEALGIARASGLLKPERALCLLHYLATGQSVAPEYDLTLPKLLCGLPLETPAPSDVGLTGAELEEADALLASVIRHWDALRSTTSDGLRGIFLLRPGKLSTLHGGAEWLLQVEPDTADILLNRLPWTLSMIQLPWMPRLLRVEWIVGT